MGFIDDFFYFTKNLKIPVKNINIETYLLKFVDNYNKNYNTIIKTDGIYKTTA